MRRARRGVPAADAARRAAAACARLVDSPWYAPPRGLVTYVACDGEIDPDGVTRVALDAGIAVYVPATASGDFVLLGGPTDKSSVLPPDGDGVLFVVPGVAFDLRGTRLGRGGGWYDQALARYPRGVRVGFAYDFQVVTQLPEASWDVRMHAVVTDARLVGEATASLGQRRTTS